MMYPAFEPSIKRKSIEACARIAGTVTSTVDTIRRQMMETSAIAPKATLARQRRMMKTAAQIRKDLGLTDNPTKYAMYDPDMREMHDAAVIAYDPVALSYKGMNKPFAFDESNDLHNFDDMVFLPYIGIADENGKDIKVGDILEIDDSCNGEDAAYTFIIKSEKGDVLDKANSRVVVIWDRKQLRYDVINLDGTPIFWDYMIPWNYPCSIKIVGCVCE
jgi:hypothetical protein